MTARIGGCSERYPPSKSYLSPQTAPAVVLVHLPQSVMIAAAGPRTSLHSRQILSAVVLRSRSFLAHPEDNCADGSSENHYCHPHTQSHRHQILSPGFRMSSANFSKMGYSPCSMPARAASNSACIKSLRPSSKQARASPQPRLVSSIRPTQSGTSIVKFARKFR